MDKKKARVKANKTSSRELLTHMMKMKEGFFDVANHPEYSEIKIYFKVTKLAKRAKNKDK